MIISTLYNLLLKNLQTSKVKFAILFCASLISFTAKSAGAVYDRTTEINHPLNSTHFTKNIKSAFSHDKSVQPVASANFLSASTQCLSGNIFDFNSNSTISSGLITNQFWDFGDGKSATGTSVTHSYFTAGSYQVKLIVTSDKGCIDSITHTVTIYPQPLAAYIIPADQCLTNNNFNFTSSASIGSGGSISSQAWDFGDGNTATGSSVSHSFATDGKYPVDLQVTSDKGCTDMITDTITVFQMPTISVTNNSPLCSGNSLTFNSVTTDGTEPYNYTWNGPNSFSSNSANPSISTISINANGTYTISVTDSNGCSSSASSSVIVNLTPVVAPIVGPLGGCVGSSINLTNSTAGGIWSSGNNSIATVDASTGIVNFVSTGNVSITYTVTNEGCSTSVSTNLISNAVSLKADIIECNNGITHFNATDPYYGVSYSNNNAGNTYLWTITGGPFSFQGASSANNRYTDLQLQTGNAFTIKIEFTSNGISCTAQQMVYKNTISADTIQGSHDTTVCNNSVAIPLSGVVSAASNSFQWTSSGSGTFSNNISLHTAYTPSAADKLAGIVKIYFTATSNLNSTGNCGYALGKDSMTLRIYPANMAANSNQTICSNQPINFSPSTSIPGSFYSWSSSILSGSVNGNSATGTGTINDSLVNTSNSSDAQVVYNITPFAFTPSNITCTGNPFNYTVIIKPKPTISISNTTASICTGGTSNIQFNSSIVNTLYAWSSSVITGAVNGNSSSANFSATDSIKDLLNNSFNSNSTIRYYISAVSNSGCNSIDSTDILLYALPTIANAGTDQVLCNVTSSMLSANIPGVGSGKWEILSGPSAVVFGTPSSPFSTVTGLVAGTYQLIWSISNGSCFVSKDTIQIINNPESIGGSISANTTVCTGLNNGIVTLSGYTGNIKGWESSTDGGVTWPNSINNSSDNYNYNNLTTSTLFRAVIQSGNCSTVYATPVSITVNNNSNPGILLKDTVVCISSNSGSLNLTGFSGNILRWESSTDTAATWQTINNAISSSLLYTNISGTTLYRAIVQNGTCNPASSNYITINVSAISNPGILASNAIVCTNNNNGILNLTGYTGKVVAWETSTNNGTSWNSIVDSSNQFTYNNLSVTTAYRTIIQSGSCPAVYSNTAIITVLQPATISDAGADQKLCNPGSTSLTANTPASGTGTWTALTSNPSTVNFTNINDPHSSVNGLVTGTYQFVWSISNTMCADSKDTVSIIVYAPTNPGILSSDATVCASSNNGTLTLNGFISNIQQWESSSNGTNWNTIANTNNTQNYSNLTNSTYYRVSVKNGICESLYSNPIRITVLPAATIADAGPDTTLINGFSSYKLEGNNPSSGIGVWSVIPPYGPSNLIFTDKSDPTATIRQLTFHYADSTTVPITPPSDGIYYLKWTISNGICAPSESIMVVTVQPPTNPGFTGTDTVVCSAPNNGIVKLTNYFGDILQWEDSTANVAGWHTIARTVGTDQDTIHFENLTATTIYRALVKNGVGLSLYSGIAATITVLDPVSIADAGADSSICNTTSIQLYGNSPSKGTGTWTYLSGAPTTPIISNNKDPKAIISGLSIGIYHFVWMISNGSCNNSMDTVTITIQAPTNPGTIAASNTVCLNNNAGILQLTGYTGSVLGASYSTDDGLNWLPIINSANKDNFDYNNLSITTKYRAEVKNGVCPSLFSNTVTITVLQIVSIANAGIDQSLCNQTATKLSANAPSSGTGSWTALGTNPSAISFSDSHDPNATISGLIAGTYQIIWTISNMLCADSKDTVQIIVYPPVSTGNLVADNFVCIDSNKGKLELNNYKGEIVQWESSIDNGINWTIIPSINSSYTYNNLLTKTQFRVLLKSGPCNTGYSNLVTISVNQLTAPGTISSTDSTVCKSYNNGTINLTGYNGIIIHWEYSEDNGKNWTIINNSTNHLDYTNLTTATEFRVLAQSGVCSMAYSNQLQISITAATIAGTISGNTTVCSTNNNGSLTLNGNNGNILHWESSNDNGNNWTIIANSSNLLNYQSLNTTTVYRALVQNGSCSVEYTNSVTINVAQAVTLANAGPNQVICNSSSTTILKANTPVSGEGIWSMISGPSDIYFNDATLANTAVNGLVPGTYQFAWKIENGICAASSSIVSIIVDKLKVDFTLTAINDCGSTTYQFADASKALFGIANFKWSSAPGDTTTNNKNYSKVYAQPGQNKVSLTVQSNTGCTVTTGASYQVKVFFVPKANINAINEACKNQLLQLSPTLSSKDSINAILWNLGNGINTKDSLVSVQYYSEGKYTIKLLVSTVNKCYDSTVKDIAIRPLPIVLVPAENFVCKGDTVRLTATGATNYIWKDQQNNIVCNGCNTYPILPTNNSVYSVIGYNQYGCSQIANTNVKIVQPIKIVASLIDTLCQGTSIKLKVAGADTYTWMPDAGLSNYNSANPIASPLITTIYTVVGKENHACFTDTARIKLVVGTPTAFSIGTDTVVQSGVGFKIMANSNELQNIRRWQWGGSATFSCINCQTTIAKAIYDAAINCIATNIYGCTSTDTIEIKTFCPNSEIFIPNAFSPDGDGINDILFVQGSGIKLIKSFRIFSRWGELVFERTNFQTGDPSNGWDGKIRGKAASQDVFVYICEAICEKGTPATFKGNIAVLK